MARKKIFINGVSGLIGFHLAWRLRHKYLVSGTCFRNQVYIPGVQVFPVTLKSIDVLEAVVRTQSPDFVIGAIGISDRKEVEDQPKVSDMVNVMIPVSLAILSSRLKAKYVHLGCAEVFDGDKGNYSEEDTDFTLTDAVGKQKIAAHSFIRAQTLESTTLRVGRVLGVGHFHRGSFFDRIRGCASDRKAYEASKNKVRSYISVDSLALAIERMLEGEFPSRHRTFHVGGANMPEYEMVRDWYQLMGTDPKLVTELKDTKRDLSLDSTLMSTTYPGWKPETRTELFQHLVNGLCPAVGTKRWQKQIAALS